MMQKQSQHLKIKDSNLFHKHDLGQYSASIGDLKNMMGLQSRKPLILPDILGAQEIGGLLNSYANQLWDDILGFADYCLAGNTKVAIPSKNISSIEIKNLVESQYSGFVLSHDGNNFTPFVAQKVSQWHCKGVQPVYRYYLSDGSFVDCTSNHNFLLKNNLKMDEKRL